MKRGLRWLGRGVAVLAVLAAVGLWLYHNLLPAQAAAAARDALANLGWEDARFEVAAVSPSRALLSDLRIGPDDGLTVAQVRIEYALGQVRRGRLKTIRLTGVQWTVRVTEAGIDLGPLGELQSDPEKDPGELPFERIELAASQIVVVGPEAWGRWGLSRLVIPVEGSITPREGGGLDLDLRAAVLGLPAEITGLVDMGGSAERAGQGLRFQLRALDDALRAEASYDPRTGRLGLSATAAASPGRQSRLQVELAYQQPSPPGEPPLQGKLTATGLALHRFGQSLAAERLQVTMAATPGPGGWLSGLVLMGEAQGVTLANLRAQVFSFTAREAADGLPLILSLGAQGESWSATVGASLAPTTGATGSREAGFTVDLHGQVTEALAPLLAMAGVQLEQARYLDITANGTAAWGGQDSAAPWAVRLDRADVSFDEADLTLPGAGAGEGVRLEAARGHMAAAATLSPAELTLELLEPAQLAFETLSRPDGSDQPLRLEAVPLQVSTAVPLRWDRAAEALHLNLALRGEQPLRLLGPAWTLAAESVAVDGVLGLGPAAGTEVFLGVSAGELTLAEPNLRARGLTLQLPIVQHATAAGAAEAEPEPPPPTGRVTAESLIYTDADGVEAVLGRAEAQTAVVDGALQARGRWQVQPDLAVRVEAEMDLAQGEGEVRFDQPAYPAQRIEALANLLRQRLGAEVTGPLALEGTLQFRQGRLVPRLQMTLQGGEVRSAEYQIDLQGVDAQVTLVGLDPPVTPGSQEITVARGNIGPLEFTEGSAALRLLSTGTLFVEQVRFTWKEGGVVRAHAVSLRPDQPRIETELFFENLNLNALLGLIPRAQATGEGELFGRIPIVIQPGRQPLLDFAPGFLYARSGTGAFHFRSARRLEELLAGAAAANEYVDIQQRVVEALQHFQYSMLRLELVPAPDGGLTLRVQTEGQGMTGSRQALVLTVNFHNIEHALNNLFVLKRGSDRAMELLLDRFFED